MRVVVLPAPAPAAAASTACPPANGVTSLFLTKARADDRPHPPGETGGRDDPVAPLKLKHIQLQMEAKQQQHVNSNDNVNKSSLLAPSLLAAIVALSPVCIAPPAAPAVSVAQIITSYTTAGGAEKGATSLFRRACIGCHDAGGNIIVPGATLLAKDLHRNGIDTTEDMYRIIYSGKGRMPGFGENCTPKGQCTFGPRLQDEEIKQLAEFVKSQADQGWPQHPN